MKDERTYDVDDRRVQEPVTSDNPTRPDATYDRNREDVRREPIESQRTSRTMDQWPEMADYRRRFDDIQSQFIEHPRKAVGNAEKLVQEALDRMTASMRERIQGMHRDADSGDTEKLRLEMRSLRDFIESLGGRKAA